MRIQTLILVLLISFYGIAVSKAAPVKFQPYTITQPDGEKIECFVSGDEFFNWLHDEEGYSIIQGDDGYYYYAKHNDKNEIIASQYKVNSVDPAMVGLQKWVKISKEAYLQKRKEFYKYADNTSKAPHTGTLNNLVVYIRFSDDSEFTITRQVYDNKFNPETGVTLKSYYKEVSYNQLYLQSYHYPVCAMTTNLSYQDTHPRSYYQPYHATNNPNGYNGSTERTIREHTLLMNAINAIEAEVPDTMNIDGDNDGNVDNVCFIIRGNSGAWADLLWAHRWMLFSFNVNINGKRVYDYTFQPESQNNVYTLCHEMFHALGAPDLYHYSYDGISPAGPWDLMESGDGHMGAYMKYKYAGQSWVTNIPEITETGTYYLQPLANQNNNCYKIASPNSYSEFFVVEYRKKIPGTFENNLPSSGLLVYRIDPGAGNGNAQGPPDEVYIYRPNGTPSSNGSVNIANFASNFGRTEINDNTNPSPFLQNGSPGGLMISNISAIDDSISFFVDMQEAPVADFVAEKEVIVEGSSMYFVDMSENSPNTWEWTFEGGTPSTSSDQNPINIQYDTPGTWDVSLTVTNDYGTHTINKENFIYVSDNTLDCAATVNIDCNNPYSGTTVGGSISAIEYGCSATEQGGNEIIHVVEIEGGNIQATISDNGNNVFGIYILDDCNPESCLAGGFLYTSANDLPAGTYYVVVDAAEGVSGSYTLDVACTNVAVNEYDFNDHFDVYPNPASHKLYISNTLGADQETDIELYDAKGRLLLEKSKINHMETIDIENYPSGIYMMRFIHNGTSTSKKIQIQQ